MNKRSLSTDFSVAQACQLFEIDPQLLTAVMAVGLSRGGDFCDLFFQFRHSVGLYLHDRQIRSANAQILRGVGIRVLKGDQTGFAHTASLDADSLKRSAATAALIASGDKAGSPQPCGSAPTPAFGRHYPLSNRDVDLKAARTWMEALDRRIRGLDRRVVEADCGVSLSREQVLIANSEGLLVCDDRPQTGLWSSCVAQAARGGRATARTEAIAKPPRRF